MAEVISDDHDGETETSNMFYFHLVVFDSAETCLNQDDPLQA